MYDSLNDLAVALRSVATLAEDDAADVDAAIFCGADRDAIYVAVVCNTGSLPADLAREVLDELDDGLWDGHPSMDKSMREAIAAHVVLDSRRPGDDA